MTDTSEGSTQIVELVARLRSIPKSEPYTLQMSIAADALEGLARQLADREGLVCDECIEGSGWCENSIEGRYPCTCMTEAEPYQLLEAENADLRTKLAAAEKDAARYRYMRNNAIFRGRNGPGLYWYLPRFLNGDEPEQLDEAIDAAIGGTPCEPSSPSFG